MEIEYKKKIRRIYAKEKDCIINGIKNTNGWELSNQDSYIKRNENTTIGDINYTATNGFIDPTSIRPKKTFYSMEYETLVTALGEKNSKILLPKGEQTSYWIASRCIYIRDDSCGFTLLGMNSGFPLGLGGAERYNSNGNANKWDLSCGIFPVVTLTSGTISGNASDGYTFTTN